ncbi:MAG: hypothetical protein JST54_30585 [Deltaproteobacteria bacterium]|nr:hypothetical protein [Deltaproteobacteria bacterium]
MLSDSTRSDTLPIQLGDAPLVVRHMPEQTPDSTGLAAELALGITGGACALAGSNIGQNDANDPGADIFRDTGDVMLGLGVASAVLAGVLGYAWRGEHRAATTTEWTLDAPPTPARAQVHQRQEHNCRTCGTC